MHYRRFTRYELQLMLQLRYGDDQPPFDQYHRSVAYIARILKRPHSVIWMRLRRFEMRG